MLSDMTARVSRVADLTLERGLRQQGYRRIVGIDEAGRGAWAGPLVAAAVMLQEEPVELGYVDSKRVTAAVRERLAAHARRHARAWAVGVASVAEVDAVGPLRATHLAAHRALAALGIGVDAVIADYLALVFEDPQPALLSLARADAQSASVAAASLLAKTHRDALMLAAAVDCPAYGFERHKGYGVAEHRTALRALGPSSWHRRSVRPVRECDMLRGVDPA
jgi:ribonuclease HII